MNASTLAPAQRSPRDEPCECTNCGWTGPNHERVWARHTGDGLNYRGYLCPECHQPTTQLVQPDKD